VLLSAFAAPDTDAVSLLLSRPWLPALLERAALGVVSEVAVLVEALLPLLSLLLTADPPSTTRMLCAGAVARDAALCGVPWSVSAEMLMLSVLDCGPPVVRRDRSAVRGGRKSPGERPLLPEVEEVLEEVLLRRLPSSIDGDVA
jgi:hypothetical protein